MKSKAFTRETTTEKNRF